MRIHTVPLNLGDLMGGTSRMDAAEFGAYALLFLNCYQDSTHILPLEEEKIRKLARCTPKVWERIRPVVMAKFVKKEDGYHHRRVEEEVQKMLQKSSKNSDNSLKRWNADNANASGNSKKRASKSHIPKSESQDTENNAEDKPSAPPVDFKRLVFNEGLRYLSGATNKRQDRLRPLLGKWCKEYGDAPTATAIMEAQKFQAVDPISFIENFLKEKKHEAVKRSLADAKPNKSERARAAVLRGIGIDADERPEGEGKIIDADYSRV